MLLRRARGLAQSLGKASGTGEGRSETKPSSKDFSLNDSELSRVVSWHIGRGASCGLLQQVASAAVRESGPKNVSRSDLDSWFIVCAVLVLLQFCCERSA